MHHVLIIYEMEEGNLIYLADVSDEVLADLRRFNNQYVNATTTSEEASEFISNIDTLPNCVKVFDATDPQAKSVRPEKMIEEIFVVGFIS